MGNRMGRGEMEKHMAQTMIQIDRRIPDGLRAAFGISRSKLPLLWLPGQQDEAANFAAVLLAPRDDDGASDPMDCYEAEPEGDLGMAFASCYIKDHDEDAHFGHAEAGVIGVADGVGGYRGKGVDASAFSRALMHNAFAEVAMTAVPGTRFCPRALLERAHQMTAAAHTPAASTAAIVSLAGRTLKWAYVGDSGFVVIRDGRILLRSRPQQHYFNCPYQLSSKQDSSRLADADVGEVAAKEGDIVILGTDGLFDNVFDDEIERMVRMGTALGFAPENMAEVIAGFACEAASCADRDTPYSSLGRTQPGNASFTGGKPDDITVVVAYVVSCPI
jgi:protein phosphatase PTC7